MDAPNEMPYEEALREAKRIGRKWGPAFVHFWNVRTALSGARRMACHNDEELATLIKSRLDLLLRRYK